MWIKVKKKKQGPVDIGIVITLFKDSLAVAIHVCAFS